MKKENDFNWLIYIIFIFPFFRIPIVNNIPVIGKIYTLLEIISFFLFFFFKILKNKYRFSKIIYGIIAFFIVLIISTLINHGNIKECLHYAFATIAFSIITDYYVKNEIKYFFKAASVFFTILIIINFIALIIWPNGVYTLDNLNEYTRYSQNWVLGYKNDLILFILPTIFFNFLYSFKYHKKLLVKDYIIYLICFVSLLLCKSSTSLIGIFVVGFIFIYILLGKGKKIFNILFHPNFLFYLLMIITVLIVFANIISIFNPIISNVFHKNITLTGRTFIWKDVMNMIPMKPFIGYGMEFFDFRLTKTVDYQVIHAHNQLLEIIYKTGIIGLIIMFICIFNTKKIIIKNYNKSMLKFISLFTFSLGLMMITEVYRLNYWIYFVVIIYNIENVLYSYSLPKNLNKKVEKKDLISVIIPVYNSEKYLNRCLYSLEKQTYNNYEVICIDDGSTDNSKKILQKFEIKNKKFKYISCDNSGVSNARNLGLKNCHGKYVTFVDSDDYVNADYLEKLYIYIKYGNVDCVISNALDLNEKNIPLKKQMNNSFDYIFSSNDIIKELMLEEKMVCTCWGNLYKKELCDKLKFDSKMRICEDFKFIFEYFKLSNNALIIKDKIYNYVVRNGSTVNSNFSNKWFDEINFCNFLIDYYAKTNYSAYAKKRFVRINIDLLYKYPNIDSINKHIIKKNIKKYLFNMLFSYNLHIKTKIKMLYCLIRK